MHTLIHQGKSTVNLFFCLEAKSINSLFCHQHLRSQGIQNRRNLTTIKQYTHTANCLKVTFKTPGNKKRASDSVVRKRLMHGCNNISHASIDRLAPTAVRRCVCQKKKIDSIAATALIRQCDGDRKRNVSRP